MSKDGGRFTSIARHFRFVGALLRGRELERQALAELVGVKPPMADRLITAAKAHLPRVKVRRKGKSTLIRMDMPVSAEPPSYPVAVAACFGASLWPLFEGSNYQSGIRDALDNILSRTRRKAAFKNIDRKFWFLRRGGEPALLDRSTLLDEVIEAVLHHHPMVVEYVRFHGKTDRLRLEPLSVVVHDHQLYVVARSTSRERTLHPYRFSRMKKVDVLDDKFEYPTRSEYDPAQVFHDSFGVFLNLPPEDVVLRLHKRWETFAQTHRWHVSQVVEVHADHVRLQLRVGVCPELEAWILGFGDEAEVMAPTTLRESMRQKVLRLAARYRM